MIAAKTLAITTLVLVHSWYPSNCCGGSDCKPIPCSEIRQVPPPQGYSGRWLKWDGEFYSPAMQYDSPDGMCHACAAQRYPLIPSTVPKCIFTPPPKTS